MQFRLDCASYALLVASDPLGRDFGTRADWAPVSASEAVRILRTALASESSFRPQLIHFWMRYDGRPERGRFQDADILERLLQGLHGGNVARLRLLRRWDLIGIQDLSERTAVIPDVPDDPRKLHFIEVELADQDGEPHRGVPIELTDTDGRLRALSSGRHGIAYVGSLEPGSCKIVVAGGEDDEPLEEADWLSISLAFADGSPAAGARYVVSAKDGEHAGALDAGGCACLAVPRGGQNIVAFPELPTASRDLLNGVQVAAGAANRLVATRTPLCHRVRGFLFESNKAFMLPEGVRAMQIVARAYADYPDNEVVVVGHTDTTGARDYNKTLSGERAAAVAAYLRDDEAAWIGWYDPSKPAKRRWGAREDELMAGELRAREQEQERDSTEPSELAVAWFQRARGMNVTGKADQTTREALIREYMAADDTSLPAGTSIRTRGDGEDKPLVDTGDSVAEQQNRRVEILFCPPGLPEPEETAIVDLPLPGGDPLKLTVGFAYRDGVLAGKPFRVAVGEQQVTGTIPASGEILVPIAMLERSEEPVLEVQPYSEGPWYRWELQVGGLEDALALRGAQARLSNRGFDPGAFDGQRTPGTKRALRAFQQRHGLLACAELNDETADALLKAHGC